MGNKIEGLQDGVSHPASASNLKKWNFLGRIKIFYLNFF
jgi:hypothetical protein